MPISRMMKRLRCLGACGVMLIASPLAWAQGEAPSSQGAMPAADHRSAEVGERTERLLELQRSGRIASRNRQSLSGEVQSRIYERYLQSFTHAIPDEYIDLSFGE
ncbi:DUF3613 domain-containing protein [Halomonas sp. SL1]|uniref:DUF3613 domain-containing protein n=1 Tax=Halomonas sp. SL1 TaxID=2137478 RepID=UPI0015ECCA15|nr:DUF3613 domain-containing protein [Halomonas sp. SL1]